MRWPFRRERGKTAAQPPTGAGSTPDQPAAPAVPAGPVVRPSGRQWLTLPPLPVTVRPTAPLVSGPAPVVPGLPGHRKVSGPAIAPATGRVDGLATVVPHVPEPAPRAVVPLPEPERPLVHRRRVRPAPPVERPTMVDATGGFVGEARTPAVPHRAPGWMRYVPEWLSQSTQSDPDPAPVAPRPKPVLPPSKIQERPTTPPTVTPAAVTPTPASSSVELAPAPPARRRSLGQTRRLGLGAPLRPAGSAESAEPVAAPVAEPAAAPVVPPVPAPVAEEEPATEDDPPAPPPPRPDPPPLRHPRVVDPAPVTSTPTSPVAPLSARPSPPLPAVPARPVTRPAATAVPLTYRAAPGRPRPRPQAPPPPAPVAPRPLAGYVPPDLASALRGPHQVDVSSIPVHRGPQVSVEARALGARAFTRGGEVFLPAEAGPLDTPKARGLLAHELVHAVQQRTLGPSLPAAHTPAGMALEAEAVAVEHAHSGHAGHAHAEPAPLRHPSLTQVLGQAARTVGVQLAPLAPAAAPPVPTSPAPPAPAPEPLSAPVREEIDLIAESSAIRTIEEWTAPPPEEEQRQPAEPDPFANGFPPSAPSSSGGPPSRPDPTTAEQDVLGRSLQDRAMAEQILQVINVERAADGHPELTTLDENAMEQIRRMIAERTEEATARSVIFAQAAAGGVRTDLAESRAQTPPLAPVETVVTRPAEPVTVPVRAPVPETVHTDPSDAPIEIERLDLEQLTARIYDRVRSRIRMELLIDRERAGLLTDFR